MKEEIFNGSHVLLFLKHLRVSPSDFKPTVGYEIIVLLNYFEFR